MKIILIVIPIVCSLFLFKPDSKPRLEAEFVVVQPNLDCYAEKFNFNARTGEQNPPTYIPMPDQMRLHFRLADSLLTSQTAFVLFPETSIHDQIQEDAPMLNQYIIDTERFRKEKNPNLSIISGIDAYKFYDNIDGSPTARSTGTAFYDAFNAAIFLGKDSVEIYRKSKLVIGVESNPFGRVFKWFDGLFLNLNLGGMVGGLGSQPNREVFCNRQGVCVAPVICYESVYGEFCGEYVRKGANVLGIITNDGWWDDTEGHRQHWQYARLLAIEMRRNIARAANTGISGYIDERGNILNASTYDQEIALRQTLTLHTNISFYAQHGDYLGRLAAFLAAFLLIAALVRKKLKL